MRLDHSNISKQSNQFSILKWKRHMFLTSTVSVRKYSEDNSYKTLAPVKSMKKNSPTKLNVWTLIQLSWDSCSYETVDEVAGQHFPFYVHIFILLTLGDLWARLHSACSKELCTVSSNRDIIFVLISISIFPL